MSIKYEKIKEEIIALGIKNYKTIYLDNSTAELYEQAIRRHEGVLSKTGALIINTVPHTGRSPNDKFIVKEETSADKIWWGDVNRSFKAEKFENLKNRVFAYLQGKDLFVQNCSLGHDEKYNIQFRVISERATGALFARTMLLKNDEFEKNRSTFTGYTIIHVPSFHADPSVDETNSGAFIIMNFGEKLILIGGTSYSGEIKKSAFTVMNYLLPQQGVMAMHASANYSKESNDTAIFFGLSGTGKTTLSADITRTLIGDDEHGWGSNGVFNFEGGCYAKTINLSTEQEPEIYNACQRFGTILENVMFNSKTREVDFYDGTLTENTRASYPISHIINMTLEGKGGHPNNIIMLTCDAFGILPPVAELTIQQAMYYFICGYTAKVAGTEAGIKEPKATFSPCFGAPFMALPPGTYAKLLGEKIKKHNAKVWLVNTGWTGGPYGVGERIKLSITRKIVNLVLSGEINKSKFITDPIFNLKIPTSCDSISESILLPKNTWKDKNLYEQKAHELKEMFEKAFNENADTDTKDLIKNEALLSN